VAFCTAVLQIVEVPPNPLSNSIRGLLLANLLTLVTARMTRTMREFSLLQTLIVSQRA